MNVIKQKIGFYATMGNIVLNRYDLKLYRKHVMFATQIRNLNFEDANPYLKNMKSRANDLITAKVQSVERRLKQGPETSFTKVIKTHIGDSHAMGQKPITFIRQVLALVLYPELMKHPRFPEDAKQRAGAILSESAGGSIGSYTSGTGLDMIRKHVAEYIGRRDGVPANWRNIALTAAGNNAMINILKLLLCSINDQKPGVMIPVPHFPFYSAVVSSLNMEDIRYYLDEENNWQIDTLELHRAFDSAKTCTPRAIIINNPGNPTSHVLSRKNIEEIVKFAYDKGLFVISDEIYQDNVYSEKSKFHSFKKVSSELGEPYNKLELASIMSCSKGYAAECGLRGGCVELFNMCPTVKENYFKSLSTKLCAPILGQVVLEALVNPPKETEPSYELFQKEKQAVLDSLKMKAKMTFDALNTFEGCKCNPIEGSVYAFLQIKLPPRAIKAAKAAKVKPDEFYTLQLLEGTGICALPGSVFGQNEGKYFRVTILPRPHTLNVMLTNMGNFHKKFMEHYR